MIRYLAVILLGALAGCSGNPLENGGPDDGGGGGGPVEENVIPADLAKNLKAVKFIPASGGNPAQLTVEMFAIDTSPFTAEYIRNPALDVPGYTAFSVQEDPLDRMFVALVAQGGNGDVQAGAVADGGQFNRFFSGTYYSRESGASSVPTTGQVSYAGKYAGITNTGGPLPVPPGTPDEVIPGEPRRTTGDVFMNVNFDDNAVNGSVFNRRFVGRGGALESIALTVSDLDDNGEFLGEVEFDNTPDEQIGTYGGIIGGDDGSAMAGVIFLDNIFVTDDPRNDDFDNEVGVFVLPRCGTPGAPPICDNVNP